MLILSDLCLGVFFSEVMNCPYKMGLFEPAVNVELVSIFSYNWEKGNLVAR